MLKLVDRLRFVGVAIDDDVAVEVVGFGPDGLHRCVGMAAFAIIQVGNDMRVGARFSIGVNPGDINRSASNRQPG